MDEIPPLRYHVKKALHHIGGILNWAAKFRSLRNGVDGRVISIEHHCSKGAATVAYLFLRILRMP